MHTSKMHRDSLSRFIPPVFDRELHAKEGMPVQQILQTVEGSTGPSLVGGLPGAGRSAYNHVLGDSVQFEL